MHAVDRYLLVAAALGVQSAPPAFRFVPREEDRQAVQTLLVRQGLSANRPWIAMNVSARWLTKRWPAERFAEAADRLNSEGVGSVALIGGAAEQEDAARVRSMMRTNAVDLTGQTAVGLLPELLQQAAVLVSNDSGPMHIAAAVGTPVVALFGPTDPLRTGPYGVGHQVLSHDVACRPCLSRSCHHSIPMACLSGVTAERVVQAVRTGMRRHPVESSA
jgi:ADP-heptose:LPS heptosyltransferase